MSSLEFPNYFEILHRARQYHCRAPCKISKWLSNWGRSYGQSTTHSPEAVLACVVVALEGTVPTDNGHGVLNAAQLAYHHSIGSVRGLKRRGVWYQWLSIRLRNHQCISTGDTSVLRLAIDIFFVITIFSTTCIISYQIIFNETLQSVTA